jgi:dihydroorotate dehydrogenase
MTSTRRMSDVIQNRGRGRPIQSASAASSAISPLSSSSTSTATSIPASSATAALSASLSSAVATAVISSVSSEPTAPPVLAALSPLATTAPTNAVDLDQFTRRIEAAIANGVMAMNNRMQGSALNSSTGLVASEHSTNSGAFEWCV